MSEMKWQPISSAPKDGTQVHLFGRSRDSLDIHKPTQHVGSWSFGRWNSGGLIVRPTHWMPLPDPPKTESGE
jgi:hypothetical protein